MAIELITIGTEVLSGQTLNTNGALIGRVLMEKGYALERVTVLPDHYECLKKGVEQALERASIVITTGGLGPTRDDITRTVFGDVFQRKLVLDKDLALNLEKRYGKFKTLQDQSMVLEGAKLLPNPIGTAPGFILENKQKVLIALPGVPIQMERLLKEEVIAYLEKKKLKKYFQASLYLCLLSEQVIDPYLREWKQKRPEIEMGICPSYGTLSLYFKVEAKNREEADRKLKPVIQFFKEHFGSYLFSYENKNIEKAVHQHLMAKKKSLVLAESCTGGKMAARLTQYSGASNYFLGSFVTYSNRLKEKVLGVLETTLKNYGAVSRETVLEMATHALKISQADYAIAVSGIAGPLGGSKSKPIGTVWGAIIEKGKEGVACLFSPKEKGQRELVIEYAGTFLFSHFFRFIAYHISPFDGV